jgi:hypothetical protein
VANDANSTRIDAFERRAIWLAALATLGLAFSGFGLGFSDVAAWRVALFVATQAALVVSLGLAALALVPGRANAADVERVLFWAFVLFWVAFFLTALTTSISAIHSIGEPGFE